MKISGKKWGNYALDVLCVAGGCLIYGVSLNMFTTPNHISVGGFTGLATTLNYLFPFLPTGGLVLALNLPLFFLSFRRLGKSFFLRTMFATVMMSVFIDLTSFLPTFTDDKLLAAIAGGLGTGVGLGLVFIRGSATGGSDLLAKLVLRWFRGVSYGKVILLIDALIIVGAGFAYRDPWTVLYSGLTLWICTTVVDAVQDGIDRAKCVQIVTDKKDLILKTIVEEMDRGATILRAEGAYTGLPHAMILVVVRKYELFRLKRAVYDADPKAFMIVGDATEVMGEGFREDPGN